MMFTLITSLVLYLINAVCQRMLDSLNGKTVGLPFMPKHTILNSYETQIAQNIVEANAISERLEDIGGLSNVKEEIQSQVLLPLKHPKIFFSDVKSLHPAKGILFYGPPGTGKTMLARAIAAEANVPFISLSLSSLENKFFGESSKLLHATFSLAHKIQPCVLFFDEIDGMIRTRSEQDQSCVYGFKTEFLTHMDGVKKKDTDAVIVIGCTNCENKLDPAVRRRLPRQYKIDLPSEDEILEIFKLHLKKTSSITSDDLRSIVASMKPGCSGSDISDIVQTAWSLQMIKLTQSPSFQQKLVDNTTTAKDIENTVNALEVKDIVCALQKKNMWNNNRVEVEVSDDDEVPPPE